MKTTADVSGSGREALGGAAAFDHRNVGSSQGPMTDEIGFDNWKGKQVLKLRFRERAASRPSGRPK
jgi:hypothetical protein